MSLRRWVEANRELTGKPLPEGGFSYHVPAGALGYIFEDEDGDLMVAFPQSWMLLDLQNIRPVGDLPSIEDAMADVSLYEGHYSNKVDEYQYHIKLRSLKWPQIIEDYDDELTAWNWFLESLCHDELDNMMSSDCGLKKLFPDKIHQWRIAGNQGGYLIVETASAQHNSNELENEWQIFRKDYLIPMMRIFLLLNRQK
jgi:hypothetical protein